MTRVAGFLLLLIVTTESFGQGEANSLAGTPVKDRIVTGGGMGLGFGSVQDYISVSPSIGYMFTRKLIGGLNLSYMYTNYKYFKPSLKLHTYGIGPFARYIVYKTIFVQAEYEYLNYQFPVSATETTRQGFDSFMAGGGVIQPLGQRAALYFMALYNFSYQQAKPGTFSPYNSPWVIRAGINIGNFSF
jgi:hypothetical protein